MAAIAVALDPQLMEEAGAVIALVAAALDAMARSLPFDAGQLPPVLRT